MDQGQDLWDLFFFSSSIVLHVYNIYIFLDHVQEIDQPKISLLPFKKKEIRNNILFHYFKIKFTSTLVQNKKKGISHYSKDPNIPRFFNKHGDLWHILVSI